MKSPATPLPWANDWNAVFAQATEKQVAHLGENEGDFQHDSNASVAELDAQYIVHAANAYPRLVANMQFAVKLLGVFPAVSASAQVEHMRVLLRELGELE